MPVNLDFPRDTFLGTGIFNRDDEVGPLRFYRRNLQGFFADMENGVHGRLR
jgi:hypothetical protein